MQIHTLHVIGALCVNPKIKLIELVLPSQGYESIKPELFSVSHRDVRSAPASPDVAPTVLSGSKLWHKRF